MESDRGKVKVGGRDAMSREHDIGNTAGETFLSHT